MATASSNFRRLLFLAAILLAAASVQARRDGLAPPPAMAPSAAGGGQCPPGVVEEFRVCVELQLGLRTRPEDREQCCRLVRGRGGSGSARQAANDQATTCLCAAFSARAQAVVNDQHVNILLGVCGMPPVRGRVCPGPFTG